MQMCDVSVERRMNFFDIMLQSYTLFPKAICSIPSTVFRSQGKHVLLTKNPAGAKDDEDGFMQDSLIKLA